MHEGISLIKKIVGFKNYSNINIDYAKLFLNISFPDDVVSKRAKTYFKSVDSNMDIFVTSDEIYHFLRQKQDEKSTDISKSFRQKYERFQYFPYLACFIFRIRWTNALMF